MERFSLIVLFVLICYGKCLRNSKNQDLFIPQPQKGPKIAATNGINHPINRIHKFVQEIKGKPAFTIPVKGNLPNYLKLDLKEDCKNEKIKEILGKKKEIGVLDFPKKVGKEVIKTKNENSVEDVVTKEVYKDISNINTGIATPVIKIIKESGMSEKTKPDEIFKKTLPQEISNDKPNPTPNVSNKEGKATDSNYLSQPMTQKENKEINIDNVDTKSPKSANTEESKGKENNSDQIKNQNKNEENIKAPLIPSSDLKEKGESNSEKKESPQTSSDDKVLSNLSKVENNPKDETKKKEEKDEKNETKPQVSIENQSKSNNPLISEIQINNGDKETLKAQVIQEPSIANIQNKIPSSNTETSKIKQTSSTQNSVKPNEITQPLPLVSQLEKITSKKQPVDPLLGPTKKTDSPQIETNSKQIIQIPPPAIEKQKQKSEDQVKKPVLSKEKKNPEQNKNENQIPSSETENKIQSKSDNPLLKSPESEEKIKSSNIIPEPKLKPDSQENIPKPIESSDKSKQSSIPNEVSITKESKSESDNSKDLNKQTPQSNDQASNQPQLVSPEDSKENSIPNNNNNFQGGLRSSASSSTSNPIISGKDSINSNSDLIGISNSAAKTFDFNLQPHYENDSPHTITYDYQSICLFFIGLSLYSTLFLIGPISTLANQFPKSKIILGSAIVIGGLIGIFGIIQICRMATMKNAVLEEFNNANKTPLFLKNYIFTLTKSLSDQKSQSSFFQSTSDSIDPKISLIIANNKKSKRNFNSTEFEEKTKILLTLHKESKDNLAFESSFIVEQREQKLKLFAGIIFFTFLVIFLIYASGNKLRPKTQVFIIIGFCLLAASMISLVGKLRTERRKEKSLCEIPKNSDALMNLLPCPKSADQISKLNSLKQEITFTKNNLVSQFQAKASESAFKSLKTAPQISNSFLKNELISDPTLSFLGRSILLSQSIESDLDDLSKCELKVDFNSRLESTGYCDKLDIEYNGERKIFLSFSITYLVLALLVLFTGNDGVQQQKAKNEYYNTN